MTFIPMPETRTWCKDGVTITYLCFATMFSHKVQSALREKYLYDSPTPEKPDRQEIPTTVYMFYMAMPLIVSVDLIDDAPIWGQMLKRAVDSPNWLIDPIADFIQMERRAPDNLLMDCYEGFKQTREQAYASPVELKEGEPLKPAADPETGEVDQTALNFTESDTRNGGQSSPVKVLKGRAKSSIAPQQTAT